jgi:FtsP/CotA-like multicopper oxidase with cupredoxin domain
MKRTMNMTSQFSLRAGMALALSVLVGLPLGAATASATPTSIDLCAVTGTMTLAGEASPVPIWGYVDCTPNPSSPPALTRPGGPTLAYNQGDVVSITLHNNLPAGVATGLVFPGLPQPPDRTGVAPGGTKNYSFTVNKPGTFLYQAALLPKSQYQVAMGLYGAMSVLPSPATGKAYADAVPLTQDSGFTTEATLVLSEIDPALNKSANPATFNLRNFAPRYGLINGAVSPNTAPIPAAAGDKVLLRYVNAGLKLHSMAALGVRQNVIAYDGNQLRYPHKIVAETFGPGQTTDVIATVPSSAAAGSKYAIYDGSLSLHNSSAGNGGMLTFISVAGSTVPTGTPITSGVTLTPSTTNGTAAVGVTATFTPAATAAEYFIDTVGTPGLGTAITTPISTGVLATLPAGIHVVYVHGQNVNGWGPVASAPLNLDKAGPATSGLSVVPAVSNGVGNVVLNATGSDAATGSSTVTSGAYSVVGGGTGTLAPNGPVGVTTALKATIPVGALSEGTHDVSVTSTDSLTNTGGPATITMIIDKSGPVGSATTATPNPSNGLIGVSSGVPAVRVRSSFTDSLSNIAGAEGFIDVAVTNGAGFVFTPTDGVWGPRVSGSNTDAVFADIPLATIASLSNGTHTIRVHAKDAAGNWGAATSVSFVVDKAAPTFTGITLSSSTVIASVPLVVTINGAVDPAPVPTGVIGGEYWIDGTTTPGSATPTAFTGLTPSVATGSITPGSHTIRVRIRDAAGNWSPGTTGVRSANFTMVANTIFANGFETGGGNWGWSSRSTNSTARLNRSVASALVGSFGMQAQGNNTNYVQYNFGNTAQPATPTFDAKFSFRPNGNTSAGSDIFAARTTGGTAVFQVRYRWSGGTHQVQIQVGATANPTWVNINGGTAINTIEVVWVAGNTLSLYVNGAVVSQTLVANGNSIGQVRLGSITSGGATATALMHFDGFASKRLPTPLLP